MFDGFSMDIRQRFIGVSIDFPLMFLECLIETLIADQKMLSATLSSMTLFATLIAGEAKKMPMHVKMACAVRLVRQSDATNIAALRGAYIGAPPAEAAAEWPSPSWTMPASPVVG